MQFWSQKACVQTQFTRIGDSVSFEGNSVRSEQPGSQEAREAGRGGRRTGGGWGGGAGGRAGRPGPPGRRGARGGGRGSRGRGARWRGGAGGRGGGTGPSGPEKTSPRRHWGGALKKTRSGCRTSYPSSAGTETCWP